MINKVVIAPDSFKGTMSAVEICDIIEKAFIKHSAETRVVKIPVADGGEGTVDAYIAGIGGTYRTLQVSGPMGDSASARYGVLQVGGTAVIEMAAASGLTLVHGKRRPMSASTFGTGQLLLDAARHGHNKIILGIGGSATSDGGIGALSALGVRFLDENGCGVTPDANGLRFIRSIDSSRLDPAIKDVEIIIACDVTNPLAGKNGAAHVYGPQKGADPAEVEMIDAGLVHYNEILTEYTGIDRKDLPGMGAAGGIALSLASFLNTRMESGIELILSIADFDRQIEGADFVITGEGKVDGQSVQGKVLAGIARRAAKKNVPVVALVGDVGADYERLYDIGITSIFSTNRAAVPFETARKTCREDLGFLMESLLKFYYLKRP
jgi:glycerate kinase